ncbi:MAG TPA: hypothetical protein VMV92_00525 [Streptosporangiaceae bacterium]|nr:hypothetical protein [Streptosporangiaceae bacterium]
MKQLRTHIKRYGTTTDGRTVLATQARPRQPGHRHGSENEDNDIEQDS